MFHPSEKRRSTAINKIPNHRDPRQFNLYHAHGFAKATSVRLVDIVCQSLQQFSRPMPNFSNTVSRESMNTKGAAAHAQSML